MSEAKKSPPAAPSASGGGGGGGGGPDLELKRAFAELQAKSAETRRRLKIIDMQVENERRSITHAELTEAEVKSMPEGTRLYNSVGRMFVLAPLGESLDTLDRAINWYRNGWDARGAPFLDLATVIIFPGLLSVMATANHLIERSNISASDVNPFLK